MILTIRRIKAPKSDSFKKISAQFDLFYKNY